jgi:hypothetical protein
MEIKKYTVLKDNDNNSKIHEPELKQYFMGNLKLKL